MVEWFTYNSLVPMITGTILVIIFLGLAFASREKMMVYIALGVGTLTLFTVVCEKLIVTDREEVENTVAILADHVRNNNSAGILGYISDKMPQTAASAQRDMDRVDFESCIVTGFKSFSGPEPGDNKAKIDFVVIVRGSTQTMTSPQHGQFQVTLNMERESTGQWKILDYAVSNPRAGLR